MAVDVSRQAENSGSRRLLTPRREPVLRLTRRVPMRRDRVQAHAGRARTVRAAPVSLRPAIPSPDARRARGFAACLCMRGCMSATATTRSDPTTCLRRCQWLIDDFTACAKGRTVTLPFACRDKYAKSQDCIHL